MTDNGQQLVGVLTQHQAAGASTLSPAAFLCLPRDVVRLSLHVPDLRPGFRSCALQRLAGVASAVSRDTFLICLFDYSGEQPVNAAAIVKKVALPASSAGLISPAPAAQFQSKAVLVN